ncbi:hypothetical protein M2155_008067 [Streptomyces sp. SAI-119]|nr:hypothetical protein [Streptomyces sp. SAI-119]
MTSENVSESEGAESASAMSPKAVDDRLIDEMVHRDHAEGLQLTGEGGVLQQVTKRLAESGLEGEITGHHGYDKHDPAGKNGGNFRNDKRSKTLLTDAGPVETAVPRDRVGSFEPKIVKWRQKHLKGLKGLAGIVISLAAKGLTTGEVQAHLAEVYGAEISRQTIATITDQVLEGMAEWQSRPLDAVCPVVFIDAIHVKSATARWPIGPAMWLWPSPPRVGGRSWGCGPATAARAPSTGCASSPRSRTAASATTSCWSATG